MPHTLNLASGSASQLLSLEHIRSVLQRLEDTIVFQLIERAQFKLNAKMYQPAAFPELKQKEGWDKSWTEWFLKESESTHAKVRRWEAPDEYPFTDLKLLAKPILPSLSYPALLWPSNKGHGINLNSEIYQFYTDKILPAICGHNKAEGGDEEDDGQYGSAAVRDIELLSALSRRIHFGMFVSESKFRSDPAAFVPHILSLPQDREASRKALLALITKPAVEAALLKRLAEKAEVYGADLDAAFLAKSQGGGKAKEEEDRSKRRKIEVTQVVQLYKDFVIPLTKVVEVDYLEIRLKGLSKKQIDELANGASWDSVAAQL